ncbi:hypothetical protein BDN67DRAFT_984483 [Paxillus ammoniavirescens]|nr:hypothetical protein BDN67DRAFT_984483 [Paxillus ammoniavirescens]
MASPKTVPSHATTLMYPLDAPQHCLGAVVDCQNVKLSNHVSHPYPEVVAENWSYRLAIKESKKCYYYRNRQTEQIKAHQHYRKQQGALPETLITFDMLNKLWAEVYTGPGGHCPFEMWPTCMLRGVNDWGREAVCSEYVDSVHKAHTLSEEALKLHPSAQSLQGPCSEALLTESNRLFQMVIAWISAEEEIISLMDKEGMEGSAFEYYNALSWLTDNTRVSPPKDKALEMQDPGFSQGWGYFVEHSGFKKFLDQFSAVQQQKSSCVSHNAVNMADTKSNCGIAATGIGTVDLDLQKGKSLQHAKDLTVFNISYDIACQWSKNIWQCMAQYPTSIHFDHTERSSTWLMPKIHLLAHISLYGKAPECGWANINPVTTSTQEMGPGHSNWNWKKVTTLGTTLQQKLKEAVPKHNNFIEFKKAIPPSNLTKWRLKVEAWEKNNTEPNPFKTQTAAVTQAAICLELAPTSLKLRSEADLTAGSNHEEQVHTTELWLPSKAVVKTLQCNIKLCKIEWKLHTTQANNTLSQLCQQLHLNSYLVNFKREWVMGQRVNMRSQTIIKTVQAKIVGYSNYAISLHKHVVHFRTP